MARVPRVPCGSYLVAAMNGRPRYRRFRAYPRAVAYAKTLRLATIDRMSHETGALEPVSTVTPSYIQDAWSGAIRS